MEQKIDQTLIPKRTLPGGEQIPCMGLGTFGSDKYGADVVSKAVYGAIRYGYRLIDCASVYQNEAQIGQVFKRLFEEGEITRKELFVTSKVWNDRHGEGEVIASCKKAWKIWDWNSSIVFRALAFSQLPCAGLRRGFQESGFQAL